MKKLIGLFAFVVMFSSLQTFAAAQNAIILVNSQDSGVVGEVGSHVAPWEFARRADIAGLEVLAFMPITDADINEIDDVVIPAGREVVAMLEIHQVGGPSQILKFLR